MEKTRKVLRNAPATAPDVTMPRQRADEAMTSTKAAPPYFADSSCTTTKEVAPMSYPKMNPPRAGKKKRAATALVRATGSSK